MKLCEETITVFNSQRVTGQEDDVYVGTVITGVSWHSEVASTVDGTGLKAADKVTIRIPLNADFSGKEYIDPIAYQSCDSAAYFTLKNGDIIVKGNVDADNVRPADLQRLYPEMTTILGVTDNRRAPNAKHWRVTGS